MLELDLSARRALEECSRRGLGLRSERELAGRAGSHHWRLHRPGRAEPPAVYALIAPNFENLALRGDRDPSRPEIEFYPRRDVVDLLLPVA